MGRTYTAEIIGPAGSGKSTLTNLLRHDATIKTGLSIWGLSLPLLATGTLLSLKDLVKLIRRRVFTVEEVKLVIQINALRRLLSRESEKGYRALMMDEGGVFGLAKLQTSEGGTRSNTWMSGLLNRMAPTLDTVIWLDASDAVLAQRIREREKPHRTKHLPDAAIREHLARYRAAFEQVVAELTRRNSLKVIRFRTDRESLEAIAKQILATSGGQV
ncbi:MAG TPA: hypothetical protein VJU86_13960 [Pyrinomonadaceae bacterium]|nr:hypothetical protein [Pyrinomonadaceae bacterium]